MRSSLRKNRKGSQQDMIYLIVTLFGAAIILLILFMLANKLNDQWQVSTALPTESKNTMQSITNTYSGTIDNMFLVILVMLSVGALMLAAMVRFSPIFIPFFFILLMFIMIVAGALSNAYEAIAESTEFIGYSDQLIFTTTIISILPYIVAFLGIILMVVMYKTGGETF